MNIIIAALIALLAGVVVKLILGVFASSRPYADVIGLIVAILVFLHELGVF